MSANTTSSSSAPEPSPSSAVAWVQLDQQGNRWVFFRSSNGTVSRRLLPGTVPLEPQPEPPRERVQRIVLAAPGPESEPAEAASTPASNCIWTGFGWFC
jgi:hypothetical protein